MTSASGPRKIPYHHHHVLHHKQAPFPSKEPALIDQHVVDKLLIDSVKTICEEVAAKEGIQNPVIESVALESITAAADEFILRFLSKVRRSMQAARRTAPIPNDFESAIYALDVARPDDQLAPYKTQPTINPPLYPTPPPDDVFHNTVQLPPDFLGPDLDGHGQLKKFAFNTSGLPALPSAHTFKHTALYPVLEKDTRKIRELATQEGKLGEHALRKLAGAVKLEATHPIDSDSVKEKRQSKINRRWTKGVALSEEAVFEETLRELLAKEPGGFELGPIVTCEKAYRMPDDAQIKRRAPVGVAAGGSAAQPGTSTTSRPEVTEL
ncbi:hypothetical protein PV10_00205 [Exophiala mesophila]|uniref:Transcription initiation factor TFIID subunit 8 n=1 Tax=Exophiala mesophila TaxID=212818 RepID=A0A0D2ABM1_EXOME|nr:uncharacterized protein PV10_00205 [Exophiala mesophila]KIV96323.1 hypothetical protein PV10_00205 [Exophiala mesophila]